MQKNGHSSVLFSDIRDFTEFTATQGDRQALRLSQLHREFAVQTMNQLGYGKLIKTYGDGVMLQFDSPDQAVEAASRLQNRANDHTQDAPEFPLLVGVGIHDGEVIEEDDDLFGMSVNLAKRLADEARSGQIVASKEVLNALDGRSDVARVPLGEREIKGIGVMALYEIVWRKETIRLTTNDHVINLVLTSEDKLVIELGKLVRQELESLQSKVQEEHEEGEAPALVKWMMKKSESWLPQLINKALIKLGIGIEHRLENVRLWTEGAQMDRLFIRIGQRTFDLGTNGVFDQAELKLFLSKVQERQDKLLVQQAHDEPALTAQPKQRSASVKSRPPRLSATPSTQGPFLRRFLIDLSQNKDVQTWFSSLPIARSMVERFVAGETLEEALHVAQHLESQGIVATLNYLGEETHSTSDAKAATEEYLRILTSIEQNGLKSTISFKPTQIGMAYDLSLVETHLKTLLARAQDVNVPVCMDMEGSSYTQITLELYDRLKTNGPVSTALQANLRRTAADLDDLIETGSSIRLVKGAYLEHADIGLVNKIEVDDAFNWMIDQCLLPESREKGTFTAIATQDEQVIRRVCAKIEAESIPTDTYEFQMLYGIRRDLQLLLADAGHRVRVYVSYGTEWYPYFMRRLAERPANILFLLKNMMKA
jgi:proline dehydrogenase